MMITRKMNPLDTKNPSSALGVVGEYIAYMGESVNFAASGLERRLRELEERIKDLERGVHSGKEN